MNFVDATIVRFTDASQRATMLDEVTLRRLLDAAYDTGALPLDAPYSAVFDSLQIGFSVPRRATAEGIWQPIGGTGVQTEARFTITGLGSATSALDDLRIDALWRGAIVARTSLPTSKITGVRVTLQDLDTIEQDVAGVVGSSASDPVALEAARRVALRNRLTGAGIAFDDAGIDRWLRALGYPSASALLAERHTSTVADVGVSFSPAAQDPPSGPRAFAFTGLVLVRETLSVAALLAQSKDLREQVRPLGLEASPLGQIRPREPLVVIWVVPASVFDDPDWPAPAGALGGGTQSDRAIRAATAGQWLANEGIGLVAI